MRSPHLRVAAPQGLLLAWAPAAAAPAESPSSIRMAVIEPGKLTTTMSYTKDGKMSVMEEALRSVVPHASRLGGSGGGDGIPSSVGEEKQEQQQQHLRQGGGGGGEGGWDGITGGTVVITTATAATAVSTATLTTTTIVAHERAEAAPLDRHPATTGTTTPSIASAVSTTKKVPSPPSLQTNDAASALRWQHDTGLAVTAIWVTVVIVFVSIARFSVESFT